MLACDDFLYGHDASKPGGKVRRRTHSMWRAAGVLAVVLFASAAAAPAASAHGATITTFGISGARPTATAGVIELKIAARDASTCTLTGPVAVIGGEWEGRCSTRVRVHRIWIAENATERAATYRLRLVAHGKHGSARRTLTITIPAEPKFDTGFWKLTVGAGSEKESYVADFEADGLVTLTSPPDTGSWSYMHRVLKFNLSASGGEPLFFEVSGPPGGPLTGTYIIEGHPIPVLLERE